MTLATACEPNEPRSGSSSATDLAVREYVRENSADETTRLQRAIDDLSRSGGGRMILPAALVPIRRLSLPPRVTLTGSGAASGLTKVGASATWLSVAPGTSGVALTGLNLELGALARSSMLTVNRGTDVLIESCRITNVSGQPSGGIELRAAERVRIAHCSFTSLTQAVKIVDNVRDAVVEHCTITRWRDRGIQVLGTVTSAASNIHIDDNHIAEQNGDSEVRQPIQFNGVAKNSFRNIAIRGNTIGGNGRSHRDERRPGTADQISLHAVDGFEISGNTCTDGGEVGITVAHGSQNGKIADNIVERCDVAAIAVGSPDGPRVRNISVVGNVCTDFGLARVGPRPAWALVGVAVYNASGVSITGNTFGSHGQGVSAGVSQRDSADVSLSDNRESGLHPPP